MSNIDEGTRILNIDDRDSNWVKILTDSYIPASEGGYTNGLLSSLQVFYNQYALNPANITEGFDFTGTVGNVYQVKVSDTDIAKYLGDTITVDSGLTLTVDGTSNQVLNFALDIQESSSTNLSLLKDAKTIKKIAQGTGLLITSTTDEVTIAIDEAFLEDITYGIKYSFADETEMLAETEMGDNDLGVREDLSEVWKYTTSWNFFFSLGSSTTNKTAVSSSTTESLSGTSTNQQEINEEVVIAVNNNISNIESNEQAIASVSGGSIHIVSEPTSQSIPTTQATATFKVDQISTNEDIISVNETINQITLHKIGRYLFQTTCSIDNSNSSSKTAYLITKNIGTGAILETTSVDVTSDIKGLVHITPIDVTTEDTVIELQWYASTTGLTCTEFSSYISSGTLSGTYDDIYYKQDIVDNLLDTKSDIYTTLAGYGITDAYTKTEISDNFIKAVGETRDISTTGGGEFGGEVEIAKYLTLDSPDDSTSSQIIYKVNGSDKWYQITSATTGNHAFKSIDNKYIVFYADGTVSHSDGTLDKHSATVGQMKDYLPLTGGELSGDLTIGGNIYTDNSFLNIYTDSTDVKASFSTNAIIFNENVYINKIEIDHTNNWIGRRDIINSRLTFNDDGNVNLSSGTDLYIDGNIYISATGSDNIDINLVSTTGTMKTDGISVISSGYHTIGGNTVRIVNGLIVSIA